MSEEIITCPVDGEMMSEMECEGCNFLDKCWMVERQLIIRLKGKLKEINNFCAEVGEISNKYDIEVEFC